ncbi:hypothetical protein JGS6364_10421 [[Clostridium] sordellii]|uniref:Uncharacterized protein n=1 Tax=Paraclostridium sordellii TaxID=1505 RepID=A0A0A1RYX9_PARSO|nr:MULTISPECIES: hypothetical protein [Paeniclostridium]AUN13920.1 hypothetical protein RSJ16_06675 [Paeniclostridium sordellii]EPZ57675.1 hypothetical protein H476_1158 [[Clostridium] sordellii VPI 9048] [Paeniclostridium sordellii VPI 9048]MBS6022618.1 hypothetical protein [Paeniclostridium sordellii]MBW4863803.1 hypothetical protein [Paeniclostridium sp.]MBW4874598.1 hypothetical protein [Paeniclostridium sp.]
MNRRYERLKLACKSLSEEAFKAYAGKKDYKRAIECYTILATSLGVPNDIAKFSQNMLARLNKKIEEKSN